jgi:anti-anti-sigma factor
LEVLVNPVIHYVGNQAGMQEPQYRHLNSRIEEGVLVLTITETEVQGEDIARALRSEMLAAADACQPKQVVVDFRYTRYISSAAFWPLLSLYRKLREVGGRLTVCGLSPVVGDVFYTTRLVSSGGSQAAPFGVEPDVDSALARIKSAGNNAPPSLPS